MSSDETKEITDVKEEFVTILGDAMPRSMFQDFCDMLTPGLKGYKFGCATPDFKCPVCYESEGGAVVITDCDHMYHLDCLEKWMENKNNCPMCRNIMPGCDRTLVEQLLLRLKEHIKAAILRGWWEKLEGLSREEIGQVSQHMNAFVDTQGWNTANWTQTFQAPLATPISTTESTTISSSPSDE